MWWRSEYSLKLSGIQAEPLRCYGINADFFYLDLGTTANKGGKDRMKSG